MKVLNRVFGDGVDTQTLGSELNSNSVIVPVKIRFSTPENFGKRGASFREKYV